jgi:hypothetical protein
MASKIGRFVPLAISGAVLIGFLLNFKVFGVLFDNHYRFGAGVISAQDLGDVFFAPLIALIYLHFSMFFLFVLGLLLFVFYKRMSKGALIALSLVMLLGFLIRPVVTLVSMSLDNWSGLQYFSLPTITGQWIGLNENRFGIFFSLKSYVTGLFLLLLLIANLIMSFARKGNVVHAAHGYTQQIQAQAARPMSTPMPVQQLGISVSMTQELERLQQMYNSGALTEEEFTVAKKRVLGN